MAAPDPAGDGASSWYAATVAPPPPHPALAGDIRADVCVVGGGYTGLHAALTLAERGFDTVLVEARSIGWGASGRNGGQIITGYNADPGRIEGWVGAADARHLWEMGEEAKSLLADRVQRHGIACDLRWGFAYAALKPRQMAALRQMLTGWRSQGYDRAGLVEGAAFRALVDSPRYIGGVFDPGSGQIHPLAYALGLGRAAAAAGVRIFEGTRVIGLDPGPPGPACVTARGRIVAGHVILAGNAYLGRLVPAAAARLMPVATGMIATEPLGPALAAAVIPGDIAVSDVNFVLNYFRRTPDHRLLFGGGVSYSGRDDPQLRRTLAAKMTRVFPQLAGVRVDMGWTGLIGISMNRMPHFGRFGRNIYFAQGFSGHGVALAGLAGRLMAEAVAGSAERFDVFTRIPHAPFPGGPLRRPALVLAMAWLRLRDLL